MAFLQPSMFVWLDKTGSDRCNNIRCYGFGLRCITPVDYQLCIGGSRVSATAVMSMREDMYVHEGTVNGNVFEVLPVPLPLLWGLVSHRVTMVSQGIYGQGVATALRNHLA